MAGLFRALCRPVIKKQVLQRIYSTHEREDEITEQDRQSRLGKKRKIKNEWNYTENKSHSRLLVKQETKVKVRYLIKNVLRGTDGTKGNKFCLHYFRLIAEFHSYLYILRTETPCLCLLFRLFPFLSEF